MKLAVLHACQASCPVLAHPNEAVPAPLDVHEIVQDVVACFREPGTVDSWPWYWPSQPLVLFIKGVSQ